MSRKLIIASTSTIFGGSYLEYLLPNLNTHFENCKEIVFIPFARPGGITYDSYTQIAASAFSAINIEVKGIHEFNDPLKALEKAEGIFTGGGNTFELVNQLYKKELMPLLRKVIFDGTPYLGTSAGSNICGLTMQTTNDMPIVYPPSFKTLGVVPFNINPHYLDPILNSEHMGETREKRIQEFHHFNSIPVIGLREGSWIEVNDSTFNLRGELAARIFEKDISPIELSTDSEIIFR